MKFISPYFFFAAYLSVGFVQQIRVDVLDPSMRNELWWAALGIGVIVADFYTRLRGERGLLEGRSFTLFLAGEAACYAVMIPWHHWDVIGVVSGVCAMLAFDWLADEDEKLSTLFNNGRLR